MTINTKKVKQICIYILCIFFLSRFFTIETISNNNTLSNLYSNISTVMAAVIVLIHLYKRRCKLDVFMTLVCIYILYLFATTAIHQGNIRRIVMLYYPVVGLLCFMDLVTKKHAKEFVTAFCFLMYILVIINFLNTLLFKDTTTSYSTSVYFLGGKNQIGIAYAIGMAFVKDYAENVSNLKPKGKKIFIFTYVIIVTISALMTKSGTSIVCIVALLGLYYLPKIKLIEILQNPKSFIVLYSILWLGLVVFRVHEIAADLIVGVLNRDLTLTHRTLVWDEVLSLLKTNFLFGYGIRDSVNLFSVSYRYIGHGGYTTSVFSAHNQMLQNLYEGGLCSLVLMITIYFFSTSTKRYKKNPSFITYFGAIILILIVWLTEAPGNNSLLIMLGVCYYSKRIMFQETYKNRY